jgi:hypothetical protein
VVIQVIAPEVALSFVTPVVEPKVDSSQPMVSGVSQVNCALTVPQQKARANVKIELILVKVFIKQLVLVNTLVN